MYTSLKLETRQKHKPTKLFKGVTDRNTPNKPLSLSYRRGRRAATKRLGVTSISRSPRKTTKRRRPRMNSRTTSPNPLRNESTNKEQGAGRVGYGRVWDAPGEAQKNKHKKMRQAGGAPSSDPRNFLRKTFSFVQSRERRLSCVRACGLCTFIAIHYRDGPVFTFR